MLSAIAKTMNPVIREVFLNADIAAYQQLRTTFILKRKYPVPFKKAGRPAKHLRSKYYIYELIKDTFIEKKPDLNLILTKYVKGLGNPGDKVTVPHTYAYNKLLLPGFAVYATPENIEKYKDYKTTDLVTYSTPTVQGLAQHMSKMVLSVVMNKENPWTLQPWHIRTSFRKCGYTVPEETITMPSKIIKGPDMNLQDKEFVVTIVINKKEKVNVRCRIHHWTTDVKERTQHVHEFWKESPGPVFQEDETILNSMPRKSEE